MTVLRRSGLVARVLLMPALATRCAVRGGGPVLLTAHGCSYAGDLALLARSRRGFFVGLAAFLGAQLSYVSAYRRRAGAPVLATAGRRRFLAGASVVAVGAGVAAGREHRALALPVAAYAAALAVMVANAAAMDPGRGRRQVLAGASLFFVSDLLIAVRRFLFADAAPLLEPAIAATYAVGQWCISDGMSTAPARPTRR